MQTIGQQRAKYALNKLKDIKNNEQKDYTQNVKGIPAMILQNGLGQALAFLASRTKTEENKGIVYKKIKDHIGEWVKDRIYRDQKNKDILRCITEGTAREYLEAQREALEILSWLKRFAEAGMFGG
ncbi:MAG: type III-B CRISPR module-associated protein Cmr5 [Deltaproteobacteria bacterium]|nr:type III-B CRISPR module-associated protein Cmr5 [Deltaproteobacteria bacterium]